MSEEVTTRVQVRLTVDGTPVEQEVEPRLLLVHLLRDLLGSTEVAVGCDTSNCGACLVAVDGEVVKACNVLAVQARDSDVATLAHPELAGPAYEAAATALPVDRLPCGSCRGGAVFGVGEWVERGAPDGAAGVRRHLEGLLCRCGAYDAIVDAALEAAGTPAPARKEGGA